MRTWAAIAAASLIASAAVAGKSDGPIETIDAPAVAAMLTELGHTAEVGADSVGDPMITASWQGSRYVVLFYGCKAHKACNGIQYRAWYDVEGKVPLEPLNQWNRTSLLGRAYLDGDGDPTIEHTVRLKGGVTMAHIREERDWFFKAVSEFEALVESLK